MDGRRGRMSVQYLLGEADGGVGSRKAGACQASSLPYAVKEPHHSANTHQWYQGPPARSTESVTLSNERQHEARKLAAHYDEPQRNFSRFSQEVPNSVQYSYHYSYQTHDRSLIRKVAVPSSQTTLELPPTSTLTAAGRNFNNDAQSARRNLCSYDGVSKKPLVKRERIPNRSKRMWTTEEDELLRKIAGDFPENWNIIGINLPGRTGKQCRERWLNNLRPDIRKGGWSREEDELILREQALRGNQWSTIARMLPGRSDNAVKNRYNATLRKYSAPVSQMAMIEEESSTVDSPMGSDTF
jgi:Myb-like DNA-binding domain